jgi:hypothetical protein
MRSRPPSQVRLSRVLSILQKSASNMPAGLAWGPSKLRETRRLGPIDCKNGNQRQNCHNHRCKIHVDGTNVSEEPDAR